MTDIKKLERTLNRAWSRRTKVNSDTQGAIWDAVGTAIDSLDRGTLRVAEQVDDAWVTHEWLKKAVLLSFRLQDNRLMGERMFELSSGRSPAQGPWWDKVSSKFAPWGPSEFARAGFRAVPGSIVRQGAFIGKGVVLMPSFVNIGAYVGEGTMVDTWATVGSCAQIGKNCHISGGAGIGGVLEPLQANPTIIEDGCFIGARSEVVEGVVVKRGAVLSMGVFIGKNTPIVDRVNDGRIIRGEVPANAVVMMGVHPNNGLICPHIVKYRDEGTDAATALNDILRD